MTFDKVPLSIVIPVLNEGARLTACLETLARLRDEGAQVIVCDGGSTDDTVARGRGAGVPVVSSGRGRARQMNAGARQADGNLLVFLHADTIVGPPACKRLLELAATPGEVWGRFDVRLSGDGLAFRVIEFMMNVRSRYTGIATGDQLMFVSRALFHQVGGFEEVALMEDIRLCAALRRRVHPICPRETVLTSSRKWREEGVVRTVLLMWRLRLAHFLGADPASLARRYYGRS